MSCAAFSPMTMSLQNTSLGYQPVFVLICSNASEMVFPRLTSCTACEDFPCEEDCGTAICEVRINPSSSLSMPAAMTIAVFCTSIKPKSFEKNKKASKMITRR